jgi:hypothetical protein
MTSDIIFTDSPSKLFTDSPSKLSNFIRRIWADEGGSQTIEAVIWTPIFVIMLAITVNVSQVFFHQSQILRVVQDTNRAVSLGTLATELEAEAHVTDTLSYMSDIVIVDAVILDGFVTTTVSIPAAELMPMNIFKDTYSSINVTVVATHLMEI